MGNATPQTSGHASGKPILDRAREIAGIVALSASVLAAPNAAAIAKSESPAFGTPGTNVPMADFSPRGKYGPAKSLFTLQTEEQRLRGTGWTRSFRFEEFLPSQTGLSRFFNDADLLAKTLGKSVSETIGTPSLTPDNVWEAIDRVYRSDGDERWLRKTVGGKAVPLDQAEFAQYADKVRKARDVLMDRLTDPLFRSYFLERSNALLPRIAKTSLLGRKTAQVAFTGIVSLYDGMAYAARYRLTRRHFAEPIGAFDQSSNVARLACLTDPNAYAMQIRISLPGRGEGLVYYIAQDSVTRPLYGNVSRYSMDPSLGVDTVLTVNAERMERFLRSR